MLMVYADDFNLGGPDDSTAEGWNLIRGKIVAYGPRPLGARLGCEHSIATAVKDGAPGR